MAFTRAGHSLFVGSMPNRHKPVIAVGTDPDLTIVGSLDSEGKALELQEILSQFLRGQSVAEFLRGA